MPHAQLLLSYEGLFRRTSPARRSTPRSRFKTNAWESFSENRMRQYSPNAVLPRAGTRGGPGTQAQPPKHRVTTRPCQENTRPDHSVEVTEESAAPPRRCTSPCRSLRNSFRRTILTCDPGGSAEGAKSKDPERVGSARCVSHFCAGNICQATRRNSLGSSPKVCKIIFLSAESVTYSISPQRNS